MILDEAIQELEKLREIYGGNIPCVSWDDYAEGIGLIDAQIEVVNIPEMGYTKKNYDDSEIVIVF